MLHHPLVHDTNCSRNMYVIISSERRCDDHPHISTDENTDDSQDQSQGSRNYDPSAMMGCIDGLDRSRLACGDGRRCHSPLRVGEKEEVIVCSEG